MRLASSYLFVLALCAGVFSASSAVAEEGTLVVANKGEATVSLLDLGRGVVVATLPTGEGPHEVAVTADGKRAMVTNYGHRGAPGSSLTLIDVVRAEVLGTIDLGDYRRPHGIAWHAADTQVLVTAEADKALLVVDVEAGRVVSAIPTDQDISHMLAVSPRGDRAYLANIGSGSVSVIDLEAGKRLANVATGDGAEGVAVAAGGAQVWVTNRAADTITVLDAASLEASIRFESKGFPIRATALPDGSKVLVTRARAGDLMIYDAGALGEGVQVDLGVEMKDTEGRLFGDRFGDSSVPIGVVTDRAGRRAWIAHANADLISELDVERRVTTRTLRAGREPDGMVWTPVRVATNADRDDAGDGVP